MILDRSELGKQILEMSYTGECSFRNNIGFYKTDNGSLDFYEAYGLSDSMLDDLGFGCEDYLNFKSDEFVPREKAENSYESKAPLYRYVNIRFKKPFYIRVKRSRFTHTSTNGNISSFNLLDKFELFIRVRFEGCQFDELPEKYTFCSYKNCYADDKLIGDLQ